MKLSAIEYTPLDELKREWEKEWDEKQVPKNLRLAALLGRIESRYEYLGLQIKWAKESETLNTIKT